MCSSALRGQTAAVVSLSDLHGDGSIAMSLRPRWAYLYKSHAVVGVGIGVGTLGLARA